MALKRALFVLHVLANLINISTARAVNISNTWVLPEEGFPVFYRYFRDRISWYEADAVCQFHHSYLVTADSTSQYDAIRAYLKELDITETVWIGLSRIVEKPDFIWSNSMQPQSGEGHWQEAIPPSKNSQCVVMDPAKDFLWNTLTCGGPDIASFICEMPIPSWALGPKGCLLTELPSLTVLYIPEQSSLEMTADCGLDGTKRIACKGNADREEILKQLTCAISNEDFDDKSTKPFPTPSTVSYTQSDNKITKIWTSNAIDADYGTTTRHRRETEDTLSASSTDSTEKLTPTLEIVTAETNYDTEVTSNAMSDISTLDLIILNSSTPQLLTTISTSTASVTTERASTTTVDSVATNTELKTEDNIDIEYPSAINQGQLFSIIENGTMFDIIELNETSPDAKTLKPSTKLQQLDEKNTKLSVDAKSKPLSKKDIYKNADPKKKKNEITDKKAALKIFSVADKKEESDKKELESKEELDLNKQVEILPLKQSIESDAKEDKEIEMNLSKEGDLNREKEEDLNKEIEIFPVINDKSPHLNRTFRKELPMMADEPTLDDNKLELMDVDEITPRMLENETKIDPNIYLLNKNISKNNDSEIIGRMDKDVLKKQLLPKLLQGEQKKSSEETTEKQIPVTTKSSQQKIIKKETVEEMNDEEENADHPRPNRQRQLTRPHGRPFYPNFFSRVLG